MRIHGTLTKWNDDRGFGFITPAKGPPDIFVHISEFPREGGRPTLNELISFEVVPGPDKKQRAVRIMRPAQKARPSAVMRQQPQSRSRWIPRALTFLVVAVLGAYGYSQYTQRIEVVEEAMPPEAQSLALPPTPIPIPASPDQPEPPPEQPIRLQATQPAMPASRYSCDGRTMCSQMRSCEEATYFIRNCPDTKMDGNRDGVPCESQWCK